MYELINQLMNGMSLGAMYALIAVGYTMVYGIIKLINFAHGEFMMFGAFLGYFCLSRFFAFGMAPLPAFLLVLLISGFGAGVLAVLVDIIAYRPVRKAGRIAALLTAIGASLLLQNLGIQLLGAAPRGYVRIFEKKQFPGPRRAPLSSLKPGDVVKHDIGVSTVDGSGRAQTRMILGAGDRVTRTLTAQLRAQGVTQVLVFSRIRFDNYQLIVLAVLALSGLLLYLLVDHTQTGRAMRAASMDSEAASLMGINVNYVVSLTFFVGAFFAGVCGVLFGMNYNTIDPQMGLMPGLKAFVAAVLGGIGRVPGAILGGFVMGITEALVVAYLSSSYRDAIAFGVLILVLLIRPQGLLGRMEDERV